MITEELFELSAGNQEKQQSAESAVKLVIAAILFFQIWLKFNNSLPIMMFHLHVKFGDDISRTF